MSSTQYVEKAPDESVDERAKKRARKTESSAEEINSVTPSSKTLPSNDDDDDDDIEVEITGSTLTNANIHFPHMRHDCGVYPFKEGDNENNSKFCSNCYCYVCDVKVDECTEWKNSHCQANPSLKDWQQMRVQKRMANRDEDVIDLSTVESEVNSPQPQHRQLSHERVLQAAFMQQKEIRKYIQENLQDHYSNIMTKNGEMIMRGDMERGSGKKKSDQRITEVLAENLKNIVNLTECSNGSQIQKMHGDIPQLSLQNNFFVEGIKIGWPFPAIMTPQRQMAVHIIKALKNQRHVVLESPTGTGKSAAILCAALAWQRWHLKNCVRQNKSMIDLEDEFSDPIEDDLKEKPSKIIYCSRTHSQVAQMVASLRKTAYRPTMAILGSRERLCIHKQLRPRIVGGQRNNVDVTQACRIRVRNTEKYRKHIYRSNSSYYDDDIPPSNLPGDDNCLEIVEDVHNIDDNNEGDNEQQFKEKKFKTCPHYRQLSSQRIAHAAYKAFTPNKARVNCCNLGGTKSNFGTHDIEDLVQFGIKPEIKRGIAIYKDESTSSYGIILEKATNGFIVVESIKVNSPAEQEGSLKVGDIIISVNGRNIKGLSLQLTAQEMRNTPKSEPLILDVADPTAYSDDKDEENYSSEAACPYYLSQALSKHSELIFAPYNYVLDPFIRDAVGIELQNSVVVLDEAHNIESTLRDVGSGKFSEIELCELAVVLTNYSLMPRTASMKINPDNEQSAKYRAERGKTDGDVYVCDVAHDLLIYLEKIIIFLRESKTKFENNECKVGANQAINEYRRFKAAAEKDYVVTFYGPTGYGLGGKPVGCAPFFDRLGFNEEYLEKIGAQVELFHSFHRNENQDSEDSRQIKIVDRLVEVVSKFMRAFKEPEHFYVSSVVSPNGGFEHILGENNENLQTNSTTRFRKKPKKIPLVHPRTIQNPDRLPNACTHKMCRQLNSTVRHASYCDGSTPQWESSLVLNLLSPGILMQELSIKCRSVILASGSLAPLKSLCAELNLFAPGEYDEKQRFPHAMKNPSQYSDTKIDTRLQNRPPPLEANHVVNLEKQLLAVSIGYFRDGSPMTMTYSRLKESGFLCKLGDAIASTIERIPRGGILVFLPSYSLLKKCLRAWNPNRDYYGSFSQYRDEDSDPSIWERFLNSKGKVITETGGSQEDFENARDEYNEQIKQSGNCILLAVFRGKMSEGVSFNDDFARGVICVGIPFPSAYDKSVETKRNYNDEQRKLRKRTDLQPGMDWYKQQAYRAVSQAIGRCIRHAGDYGTIVLMDSRYCYDGDPVSQVCRAHSGLPKWMRHHIRNSINARSSRMPNVILGGWGGLADEMKRFFNEAPFYCSHVLKKQEEDFKKAQQRFQKSKQHLFDEKQLKWIVTNRDDESVTSEQKAPCVKSSQNTAQEANVTTKRIDSPHHLTAQATSIKNSSASPSSRNEVSNDKVNVNFGSPNMALSQEVQLCIVCEENPKNVLFIPCSHLCLCRGCYSSNNIKECPMCRADIKDTLPVYT